MQLGLSLGLLAFLSSFVNGLLGAGGAVLLIPLALYVLPLMVGVQLDPHHVSGLVLVQSVASALGGGLGFRRHGHLDTRLLWKQGPLLAVGGLTGALGSSLLPGRVLLFAFAIVTTGAAVLMLFRPGVSKAPRSRHHQVAAAALLFAISLVGGAIGIGAGVLIIPVLLYLLATPSRVASGTALVMTVFLTAPAVLGKAVTGQIVWFPAAFMAVAAVVGSRLGAHFNARIPVAPLRLGLAGLVGLLAIRVWSDLL